MPKSFESLSDPEAIAAILEHAGNMSKAELTVSLKRHEEMCATFTWENSENNKIELPADRFERVASKRKSVAAA